MATAAASFFGIRDDGDRPHDEMQSQLQSSSPPPTPSATTAPPAAPPKKRRNQPGTTYPDAEVIALSPKSLLATNRFVCEVCNKGFQREQNLQLHRRGHNLPWKLRQKNKDVQPRRKVYLCPEPTCAHHDPSRALGDLTGIKKHFCRKHGEKKWKCDKCSKRYAVQSDWKAHSKTCGTREYRCDCGTIFSRRDSFVTHRAFCDALAQESARLPTSLSSIGNQLYRNSNMGLSLSALNTQLSSLQEPTHPSADHLRLGGAPAGNSHFEHLLPPPTHSTQAPPSPAAFFLGAGSSQDFTEEAQTHHSFLESKPFHGLMPLSNLPSSAAPATAGAAANLFNLGFSTQNAGHHLLLPGQFNSSNGGGGPTTLFSGNLLSYNSSLQSEPALPQMSATALLQKAAQMGSTSTGGDSSVLRGIGSSSLADVKLSTFHSNYNSGEGFNETHLRNLMNSLANGSSSLFESSGCSLGLSGGLHGGMAASALGGGDGLTRDFLGVGNMVSALSQSEGHQGIGIGAFDPDYALQEESYGKRRKL